MYHVELKILIDLYLFILQWVQCARCKAWQHQICSLFNETRNQSELTEYLCPTCILHGSENGEKLLNQTKAYGAKDLPTTRLSDHIEKWLSQSLKKERQERAQSLGKSYEEVIFVYWQNLFPYLSLNFYLTC